MSVIYKSVYKHSRGLNDQSLEIAENFFKHGEAIGTRRLHKLIQELHYSRERRFWRHYLSERTFQVLNVWILDVLFGESYEKTIWRWKIVLDLKEKFNSSNFMEKSYALNRLVADFGECNGLSTTDIKPLCKMAVLNSMRAKRTICFPTVYMNRLALHYCHELLTKITCSR